MSKLWSQGKTPKGTKEAWQWNTTNDSQQDPFAIKSSWDNCIWVSYGSNVSLLASGFMVIIVLCLWRRMSLFIGLILKYCRDVPSATYSLAVQETKRYVAIFVWLYRIFWSVQRFFYDLESINNSLFFFVSLSYSCFSLWSWAGKSLLRYQLCYFYLVWIKILSA